MARLPGCRYVSAISTSPAKRNVHVHGGGSLQMCASEMTGHGGRNSGSHCCERGTIESKGITRLTTAGAAVHECAVGSPVAKCPNRPRVSVKLSYSQVARFPEGTLGRSGAHDVFQSGELSSRRSSNLRRYPWSLTSQVFGHPYRANMTDGLAYRCRPAQMDCRGLCLNQVDKNEAWILHFWQP